MNGAKLKYHSGKLILEFETVIRIPIILEAMVPTDFSTREMHLTPRENDVLGALVKGSMNKEIASEFNISERTVKFHVSSLLQKFKVNGRKDFLRKSIER